MKIFTKVAHIFYSVLTPIRANRSFFIFMYLLGILVAYEELPVNNPNAKVYDNLIPELFLDLYLVSLLLMVFKRQIRQWVRLVLYFMAYSISLIDLFCWEKFQTTINPSILLLIGETNSKEANEFLSSYISIDILFSGIGLILILILINIITGLFPFIKQHLSIFRKIKKRDSIHCFKIIKNKKSLLFVKTFSGLICTFFLIFSAISSAHNKEMMYRIFSLHTIGAVEHEMSLYQRQPGKETQFYIPPYRLAFAIFSNKLASHQISQLIATKGKVWVDSCSYTSPNIILIIGESYSKHHSHQYGYFMPTTPHQEALQKQGLLTPFSDVVSPYNLTSFVFKNIFSLQVVGDKKDWCDYPLFPEVFRKAGYHVTFITNQFLPRAKQAVYDFSGGFFLNHPELSDAMFDNRNSRLYKYDAGLLHDYDCFQKQYNTEHNLILFHLMGQHVNYEQRTPEKAKHFKADDYKNIRYDLNKKRRKILSDYDNAVLYNDSIVYQIIKRFQDKDAIIIYMPDHGEECYEGNRGFICRNHSADIDYNLARFEFEIPFWIYTSPAYKAKHHDIYKQIIAAKNKKFMTDALPHMLLYLGGIHTIYYRDEYNILSKNYQENRPRILKGTTDYDKLDRTKAIRQIPLQKKENNKK
jgi:hypothetical protein